MLYHNYIYKLNNIIFAYDKVGKWCQLPYYGHKKGCPNYNKKARNICPPFAPKLFEFFDESYSIYLIHSVFDLESHARRMKRDHSMWSEHQCRCVLYWQKISRNQLKERAALQMYNLNLNAVTYCPEAMGVNVYATALKAGLKLEKIRNLKTCRHIAFVGKKSIS